MASGCRIGQSRRRACLIFPRDNRYVVSRWASFNIMSLEKHICWVVGQKEIIEVAGLTMSFQCVAPSQPGMVSQSQTEDSSQGSEDPSNRTPKWFFEDYNP